MAELAGIFLHPVKALDAVAVSEARVLASGALAHDRRWALIDSAGHFVNGKNRAAVHEVRARFDVSSWEIELDGRVFSLVQQAHELGAYFSDRLGEPVRLHQNDAVGFPDDLDASGPTCVSQASLEQVGEWFGFALNEVRARFRTNLELGGVEAFWEDQLYGNAFYAGNVEIHAVNPCQRCVVPSRHPLTGAVTSGFQKLFTRRRQASFPATASRVQFNHYYRFAVNTRIAPTEAGKILRVGDEIRFRDPAA
ncbi:MAG TPA: MOSC N-terminal beta barrel domain-containing protein [Polyangiaceae bacterium]